MKLPNLDESIAMDSRPTAAEIGLCDITHLDPTDPLPWEASAAVRRAFSMTQRSLSTSMTSSVVW
jgi:hypothetical protein